MWQSRTSCLLFTSKQLPFIRHSSRSALGSFVSEVSKLPELVLDTPSTPPPPKSPSNHFVSRTPSMSHTLHMGWLEKSSRLAVRKPPPQVPLWHYSSIHDIISWFFMWQSRNEVHVAHFENHCSTATWCEWQVLKCVRKCFKLAQEPFFNSSNKQTKIHL